MLSYRQKTTLNDRFLDALEERLKGQGAHMGGLGRVTHGASPTEQSIMGAIGPQPDPDFAGQHVPNAMGMVFLVSPDADGVLRVEINGRFDLVHRQIPDIDNMLAQIKTDANGAKPSQTVAPCYHRETVVFTGQSLCLNLPSEARQWIFAERDGPLDQAMAGHARRARLDERRFRRCRTNARGNAIFYLDWDETIQDQNRLNRVVAEALFDTEEPLEYQIALRVRARPAPADLRQDDTCWLLEVFLENQTSQREARPYGLDMPYLLDVGFDVQLRQGTHYPLPHRVQPEDYRYREMARVPGYGITCGVREIVAGRHWKTTSFPRFNLPRRDTTTTEDLGIAVGPDFALLSDQPFVLLDQLESAFQTYVDQWSDQIGALESGGRETDAAVAREELATFEAEVAQVLDGIALLKKEPLLYRCFCLMNQTMLQAIIRQKKSFRAWRLFQLGFILTQVRAIHERCCPIDQLTPHLDHAEVLWFSTGGGKTEAYLGILVMALFYERLNGRALGTCAWMRFPLRMLSVQQFQRLAFVIGAANRLKAAENISGHPFTIGYFTGSGTPRKITSTAEAHQQTFLPHLSEAQRQAYQFVTDCPYCDEDESIEVIADVPACRLRHRCRNPACWSNTQAPAGEFGEGLRGDIGIYVSDEEIYRYAPSILVGTIDKLAVIGHNPKFRVFLESPTHACPVHGLLYQSRCPYHRIVRSDAGQWIVEACGINSRSQGLRTQVLPPQPYYGFSFLIQDELHLLRENLGNFDAHYESLLTTLQTQLGHRPAKILAATATIKRFEDHITHLYLKQPRRFPAPGIAQGESFYSRLARDPETGEALVRRIYAGVLPLGRGHASRRAVAEISTCALDTVDTWCEQLRDAPNVWLKTVGMEGVSASDCLSHIETYLSTNLMYVNAKRSIDEIQRFLEELETDRTPPRHRFRMDGGTTLEAMLKAIHHIENRQPEDPFRQILATNAVSHGVDIHRLNLLIMDGWPKSMAEYLQASARSGRIEPGIVIAAFNAHNILEYSVFAEFDDYHRFMDRLVASVPINRFAPNVLERTFPGLLSAILMMGAGYQEERSRFVGNPARVSRLLIDDASFKAQLEGTLIRSLAVPPSLAGAFDPAVVAGFQAQVEETVRRALRFLENLPPQYSDGFLSNAIGAMMGYAPLRNFRDIEGQVEIRPYVEESVRLLDALSR